MQSYVSLDASTHNSFELSKFEPAVGMFKGAAVYIQINLHNNINTKQYSSTKLCNNYLCHWIEWATIMNYNSYTTVSYYRSLYFSSFTGCPGSISLIVCILHMWVHTPLHMECIPAHCTPPQCGRRGRHYQVSQLDHLLLQHSHQHTQTPSCNDWCLSLS